MGTPHYVFHEYLSKVNEGFWFRDFVESARQNGLGYVADAQFCRWEGQVSEELLTGLAKRDLDPIDLEESIDLLCNRYFRASILCQRDAPRESMSHLELFEEVYMASFLCVQSDPLDLNEGIMERFTGPQGQDITIDASITKAAIVTLTEQWPLGMRSETLYQQASRLLTKHDYEIIPGARSQFCSDLITLFVAGQVDLRLQEPKYNSKVTKYPKAHLLARFEAEHQKILTTPYHVQLTFESEVLVLVQALDGSRSLEELQKSFGGEFVKKALVGLGRWGLLEN